MKTLILHTHLIENVFSVSRISISFEVYFSLIKREDLIFFSSLSLSKAIFCHSALCRFLAGSLGCGRKESWLPGVAVPLLPVQHTRVTRKSLRWAPTNSSHWRAMLGAPWEVQERVGPSLGQAVQMGLPAHLPC